MELHHDVFNLYKIKSKSLIFRSVSSSSQLVTDTEMCPDDCIPFHNNDHHPNIDNDKEHGHRSCKDNEGTKYAEGRILSKGVGEKDKKECNK